MKFNTKNVDIIIVGASAASMVLAAQLLKYGIEPMVVDHRKGMSDTESLITLDRLSLDMLGRLGLMDTLLPLGSVCKGLTVQFADQVLKQIDLTHDEHLSAYHYFLNIEQGKVDKALLQYLGSKACPVYWDSRIKDIYQDDSGVRVVMEQDQSSHDIKSKWVVFSDCENDHILTRLGFDHKSWVIPQQLYCSKIEPNELVDCDQRLVMMSDGFMFAKSDERTNRYHLLSSTKSDGSSSKNVIGSVALNYLQQRCISFGRLNVDGLFLLDSIINLHFQDAANLSWKLAFIISEKMNKTMLSSYEVERKFLAMRVYRKSYWLLNVLLYKGRLFSKLRQQLALKSLDNILFTEYNYRRSELSLHHSLSKKIVAGDRLPNFTVYDEKSGVDTSLHEWVKKSGFVLLLLGSLSSYLRFNIGQGIKKKYTSYVHVYYLPYSSKNEHVFKAFEMKAEQHKMILIRPDGYIGFINDVLNASLVDTYMEELMKWRY